MLQYTSYKLLYAWKKKDSEMILQKVQFLIFLLSDSNKIFCKNYESISEH